MPERGMPKIMRQGNGLCQIIVQIEGTSDGSGYLRYFDAVRQSGPEQVAFMIYEYLRLVFQAAKCRGMNNAVTITLKFTTSLGPRLVNYPTP
jgi:hypothetical protein